MIHEFVQYGGDGRVSVDLRHVEAVSERKNHREPEAVLIVTGSDTYFVTEPYDVVVGLWRKAMKEKRNARRRSQ